MQDGGDSTGIVDPGASQSLAIHLVQHPPSSDESLAESLVVVVVVENQSLNQYVMWAIPSGVTKLS